SSISIRVSRASHCVTAIIGSRNQLQIFILSSRRRHTRSKRDWSSDVCSSDLISEDERQDLMEKMVSFNTGSGATGFFNTVKALFDKYSSIFLKGAATTMVIAIFATL